jgi:O-antigen ligase
MLKSHGLFSENVLLFCLLLAISGIAAFLLCTPYYYLAPAPALSLVALLFFKQFPLIAYYMMLFSIPHNDLRGSSTKLLGALLIGIVASLTLVERRNLNIQNTLFIPVATFLIINALSFIFSRYPGTSTEAVRDLLVVMIFFFMAVTLITPHALFHIIPKVLIAGITLCACYGIYGYYTDDPRYTIGIGGVSMKRAAGTAGDPNVFSMFLLYAVPLLTHYIIYTKKNMLKILSVALIVLNIFALVLTFSRGASMILFFITLLMFFEHKKLIQPINLGLVATGMATSLVIFAVLAPSSYWERNKSLSVEDGSVSRRLDYIRVSIYTLSESPKNAIVGAGPGTFPDCWAAAVMRGDVEKGSGKYFRRFAHNTYLEVLVGTGLSGFILFIVMIIITLRTFLKAQRQMAQIGNVQDSALIGAYKISFISTICYFPMISYPYYKFFWVSLAFSQMALSYSKHPLKSNN